MIGIDDFIMLGTTVPEPDSGGRTTVCSAGVSPQLRSLIRIYPLARRNAPKRWSVNRVKLERNPKDQRPESWKLAGNREPGAHERINDVFETEDAIAPAHRADLLRSYTVDSIAEANDRRLSLAVIHPNAEMMLEFEHNPASPDSPELALFDLEPRVEAGARRFPYIPRLVLADPAGPRKSHRLMLREWGVYELMRKHNNLTSMTDAERRRYVGGALHLDGSCSLLIGNFNRHYTSWLVISVLRGLRAEPGLFEDLGVAS